MLQDALKKALTGTDLSARAPEPTAAEPTSTGPGLPCPADHPWGELLTGVPRDASIGRWQQESSTREKALKASGQKREAKALAAARVKFEKVYDKAAWKVVKDRWSTLSYPDRLYRRLKSESVAPGPVAERLYTRRAEAMASESADALWTWVTTGKRAK
jgi:hypothetical protein